MNIARFFPCRDEAPTLQRDHGRFVALGLAQLDFRLETRGSRRLHRQVTLRAAAAVVFPYHANRRARNRHVGAIGRFHMRIDFRAAHRVDGQRLAPLPGRLRRPRQQAQR